MCGINISDFIDAKMTKNHVGDYVKLPFAYAEGSDFCHH